MRFLRPLFLVLIALAWLPATNNCAYAALAPSVFAYCADDDGDTGGAPCNNRCANCVTNDNGCELAGLEALTVAEPERTEDAFFFEVLQAALAFLKAPEEEVCHPVPVDDRPPWRVAIRTTPPVRGPSLA